MWGEQFSPAVLSALRAYERRIMRNSGGTTVISDNNYRPEANASGRFLYHFKEENYERASKSVRPESGRKENL